MSNLKNRGGIFKGALHSEGGIPLVVKDSHIPIEVEGDEPLIPKEALEKKKVKKRFGTNLQILNQINKENGAKGMSEKASEVYSGDAIVCRKAAYDKTKRTIIGTDKQIVSAINVSGGCKVIETGAKAIDTTGTVVQYKSGGIAKKGSAKDKILTKEEREELKRRWKKKKENIEELANNIHRLRLNVTRDLKSEDEKTFLTALVIAVMERTSERIGNDDSADKGHYGVSGFRKKHIKIEGSKITFKYVGKSGVEQEKVIIDSKLAPLLKKAISNAKGLFVFATSDGFTIKADRVNRFLQDYSVSAKDLRGYNANKFIIERLKKEPIDSDPAKRQKLYNSILKKVAKKVGHGVATLKKHYMIPELSHYYIKKGKIIDMKNLGYYKEGGEIMPNGSCGCAAEVKKMESEVKKMEIGGTVIAEELFVKENLVDGVIQRDTLERIIGKGANYPCQRVGNIVLRKLFMRGEYKIE